MLSHVSEFPSFSRLSNSPLQVWPHLVHLLIRPLPVSVKEVPFGKQSCPLVHTLSVASRVEKLWENFMDAEPKMFTLWLFKEKET